MNRTRLGDKISQIMARNNITQQTFAAGSKLSQGSIVRLESRQMRPGPETLYKLCHCTAITDADQIDILCEHLRDEIERGGKLQDSIAINPANRNTLNYATFDEIHKAADTITDIARSRPDVAALLLDLATVVQSLQNQQAPNLTLMAAEPPATYTTKKGKKK